jgi:hypothetical protein
MNVHAINSESEAHVVAQRMALLWDAGQGTPEEEELEILRDLVEGYRLRHGSAPSPVALPSHQDLIGNLGDDQNALHYLAEALKDPDEEVYFLALTEVMAARHPPVTAGTMGAAPI